MHDLGKYTPQFQRRLEGGSRVDHSTAGAKLALERAGRESLIAGQLAAYAILGHYAGLPDHEGEGSFDDRIEAYEDRLGPARIEEVRGAVIPKTGAGGYPGARQMLASAGDGLGNRSDSRS